MRPAIRRIAFAAIAFVAPASAGVFTGKDALMIQVAPGVVHFHPSPDHARYSWLVGIEWINDQKWVAGVSAFNNSFGQKSQYIYGGRMWPLEFIHPNVYAKLTGGLLLGYKEPYENKIPFNHNGVAPGLVPSIGYRQDRFNVQLNLLGNSALMLTVGYEFLR